jgi:hypothetical protein
MANKRKKKIHKKIETVNRKSSFMLAKGVEGVKRRGASPENPKTVLSHLLCLLRTTPSLCPPGDWVKIRAGTQWMKNYAMIFEEKAKLHCIYDSRKDL